MSSSVSVKNLVNQLSDRQAVVSSGKFSRKLKEIIFKQLANIEFGELTIHQDDESYSFQGTQRLDLCAEITVLNDQFYWYVAFGGGVGAGEAYINRFWQANDLTKVIQLFALNQSVLDSVEGGLAKLTTPLKMGFHWLNKNTHKGSKNNIVAHYDLGNDFFEQFLDPTMMYSAGIFYHKDDTMHQASLNKLKRICDRLRLSANDHLLEIGTGWGSLAIFAAKNYGCKVTTTTISEEQYAYTAKRIVEEGLEDQITLLKEDYRNLTGQYDKLISVEMIEAVGHHYFDTFFGQCSRLLKPEGEMLLQAITIADQRFNRAKKTVDFIKRYIFPGSCIPSVDAISDSLRKATDMRVLNLEDIGVHYGYTLKKWREAFQLRLDEIRAQGFSEAFIRLWEFYLCYCEGGFYERVISDVQLHLVKPQARVPEKLLVMEN